MKFIKEWGVFILIILALILSRVFIWANASVDGNSMDPTLANGQGLIYVQTKTVHRFDVVIAQEPSRVVVKRVIGMPGDTVTYDNDKLTIDGKSYSEPYLADYQQQFKNGTLAATYASIPLRSDLTASNRNSFIYLAQNSKAFTTMPLPNSIPASVYTSIPAGSTHFTIKVPQGQYLLLGDDRPISQDSRTVGTFSQSAIMGKVVFRYWPLNKISLIN